VEQRFGHACRVHNFVFVMRRGGILVRMNPLLQLSSAFGLSASAGLNAYIPLLTLSVLANRGVVHLNSPYDVMGSWWCITILVILCVVELVVDKIPGTDHVNDAIQTVVRPTAGALLFATQTGAIAPSSVHPGVWITIGLLTAGSVHAAKAVARPPLNVATIGMAAPIVSTLENITSVLVSLVSILLPVLTLFLMAVLGYVAYRGFRRFFRNRQPALQVSVVPARPLRALAPPIRRRSSVA
jgi:uncharacterized membrane protein